MGSSLSPFRLCLEMAQREGDKQGGWGLRPSGRGEISAMGGGQQTKEGARQGNPLDFRLVWLWELRRWVNAVPRWAVLGGGALLVLGCRGREAPPPLSWVQVLKTSWTGRVFFRTLPFVQDVFKTSPRLLVSHSDLKWYRLACRLPSVHVIWCQLLGSAVAAFPASFVSFLERDVLEKNPHFLHQTQNKQWLESLSPGSPKAT